MVYSCALTDGARTVAFFMEYHSVLVCVWLLTQCSLFLNLINSLGMCILKRKLFHSETFGASSFPGLDLKSEVS